MRLRLVVTLLLATASVATGARAQSSATAETLFSEGKALMDRGDYAGACPKLAESQRIDPGGGTLLNLAICYEHQGKTATAWSAFKEALALARRDGRADREKIALEHATALEPTLSHLRLVVPDAARLPGLVVKIDGAVLGDAAWGSALPVDPGSHRLEATAPGRKPWRTELAVRAEQSHDVTLPLLGDAPVAPAATLAPAAGNAVQPGAPKADGVASGGGQRVIGFVAIGVGAVGLAAGSYFGLAAISKRKDSDAECPAEGCTPKGLELNDEAQKSATLSNVAFGIGVLAAGVGVYLVLSAPSGPNESATAQPAVRLALRAAASPRLASLGISGSF